MSLSIKKITTVASFASPHSAASVLFPPNPPPPPPHRRKNPSIKISSALSFLLHFNLTPASYSPLPSHPSIHHFNHFTHPKSRTTHHATPTPQVSSVKRSGGGGGFREKNGSWEMFSRTYVQCQPCFCVASVRVHMTLFFIYSTKAASTSVLYSTLGRVGG